LLNAWVLTHVPAKPKVSSSTMGKERQRETFSLEVSTARLGLVSAPPE
jgi:hypothetical protein